MSKNVDGQRLKVDPLAVAVRVSDVLLLSSALGVFWTVGTGASVEVVISGKTTEIEPSSCLTMMLNNSLHWTGIISRLSPMIFSTDPKDADINWLRRSEAELPHFAFSSGKTH